MAWHSPRAIIRRYKLYRKTKKLQKATQKLSPSITSVVTSVETNKDPIVEFSRKEIVLKTSTPVKLGANSDIALRSYEQYADHCINSNGKRKNITILNQHESPFLKLPAEIRNVIYEYVIGGRTYRFKDGIQRGYAKLDTGDEQHVLGLLFVCHQIHSEASLLPYSLNTFSFREFDMSLKPFLDHRHLAHFRAITSIELVTYQAERMWAAPDCFSESFDELKETEVLRRLPNLKEIRVIVDLNTSLYVAYCTRDFDFRAIRQSQDALENAIEKLRPDVLVRFFWA